MKLMIIVKEKLTWKALSHECPLMPVKVEKDPKAEPKDLSHSSDVYQLFYWDEFNYFSIISPSESFLDSFIHKLFG